MCSFLIMKLEIMGGGVMPKTTCNFLIMKLEIGALMPKKYVYFSDYETGDRGPNS